MLDRKQILPLGSKVSVQYAMDDGKETILLIVGHLSLRKHHVCHYDYICVRFPDGIEKDMHYINHSDIVRVICTPEPTGEEYLKWLERKYGEYETYYKNYNPDERTDIDTLRKRVIETTNAIEYFTDKKKWIRHLCFGVIIIGAGLAAFFTREWHVGVCAFLFALLGWLTK